MSAKQIDLAEGAKLEFGMGAYVPGYGLDNQSDKSCGPPPELPDIR